MMAAKTDDKTPAAPVAEPTLAPMLIDLLKEYAIASRNLNHKTATPRGIKRALATVKDIIADIELELAK
jgi:hypothetical protein